MEAPRAVHVVLEHRLAVVEWRHVAVGLGVGEAPLSVATPPGSRLVTCQPASPPPPHKERRSLRESYSARAVEGSCANGQHLHGSGTDAPGRML